MNALPDILATDSDLDYVESQDDIGNMMCSVVHHTYTYHDVII